MTFCGSILHNLLLVSLALFDASGIEEISPASHHHLIHTGLLGCHPDRQCLYYMTKMDCFHYTYIDWGPNGHVHCCTDQFFLLTRTMFKLRPFRNPPSHCHLSHSPWGAGCRACLQQCLVSSLHWHWLASISFPPSSPSLPRTGHAPAVYEAITV